MRLLGISAKKVREGNNAIFELIRTYNKCVAIRKNQIEGHLPKHAKTVVIEDLISTGGSSLKAVKALRDQEVEVLGMAAVFTYGFPIASENFTNSGCSLNTLSDYQHLLSQAQQAGTINDETYLTLQEWRRNPASWLANA